MAFLVKTPSLPSTQASGQEQLSSYREADPVPLGYGCQPYGSHWLSQQYDWVQVPAGQQGKLNYYSIAAAYRIATDTDLYIGKAILDENETYDLDYTFAPGEQSHVFTLNGALAGGFAMTVEVFRGSDTQTFSAALRAGTGQNHPPYRRTITAIWRNVVAGINQTAARQLALEIGVAAPAVGAFTPEPFSPRYGVNLFAAIYGLCRERKGGLAASDGVLDETHWGAQAIALQTVGIGQRQGDQTYAHPIFAGSAQDAAQAISAALAHIDGYVYFDGGQLKVGWFPHQSSPPTGLPTITEHDLEAKPSGAGFGDWNVGATSTVVMFKDKDRRYTDTGAKYNAPVNSSSAKVAQRVRKDRPMIHAVEQARVIAAEESADGSADDSGVNLTVFKSRAVTTGGAPLMPGDLVTWSYAPQSIALPCRVTERRLCFGAASDTLTVIRERGAFPRPFVAEADPRVPQPDDAPGNVVAADVRLWLLPSGFGTDVHRLAVLIARSKLSITGATISFSTAGSAPWSDIHAQKTFAAKCAVATTINASAGTIRVTSTSVDLARMNAQDAIAQANDLLLLVVDGEAMSVGAKTVVSTNTYDLGILRGRQGSTAAGHASAAIAWLVYRSDLEPIEHLEFEHLASGGAYNATVATKYFKIALATKDAIGAAKPDDPGLSITIPDPTPGAISGLTATAGTGRAVTLVWPAIAGATEYKTYRNTSNSPSTATALDAEVSSPTYTDMGMAPGTYWYWVAPVSGGELIGPKSNGASVTVVDVIEGGIDGTAPADPDAATFNSYGWYAAADTTIYSWIKVNLPASLPTLAKIVNVLYRKVGSTGWIVADQRTAGGGTVRIDDLSPGTSYDIALQAFSAYAIASGVVAATGSPFSAPMKTDLPTAGSGFAWIDGDSTSADRPPPKLRGGSQLYAAGVTFAESTDPHLAYYEVGTSTSSSTPPTVTVDSTGSEFECPKGVRRFNVYKVANTTCYVWQRAVNIWGTPGTFTLIGDASSHLKKVAGDLIERNGSAVGALAGVTSLAMSSARRFKKNIKPLTGPAALAELDRWQAKVFDWKTKDVVDDVGFLADTIAKFRPDAVHRDERGRIDSLDYTKAIPLLVAAVTHQQRQIDVLAAEVSRLRKPSAKVRKLKRIN